MTVVMVDKKKHPQISNGRFMALGLPRYNKLVTLLYYGYYLFANLMGTYGLNQQNQVGACRTPRNGKITSLEELLGYASWFICC